MRVRGGLSIVFFLAVGASCAGRSKSECAVGDCSGGPSGSGGTSGGIGGSSGGNAAGRSAFGGAGGSGAETGGTGVGGGETAGAGTGGTSGASGSAGAGAAPGVGGSTAGSGGTESLAGSGNAPAGGSAGMVDCSLPPHPGTCDAAFDVWYYSPSGTCEPFTFGGCEGNSNRFATEEDCYATCQGQAINDVTKCESPSDCVVIDRLCCSCDASHRESLVAVNAAHAGDRCAAVDCIPCSPPPDPNRAWYGATCTDGHCRLFDARERPITECTMGTDCTLRWGLSCCESCTPSANEPVSVNLSAGFSELVCGDGPVACDACAPPSTTPYVPACAEGRCAAVATLK
jgi:hypothetical protein